MKANITYEGIGLGYIIISCIIIGQNTYFPAGHSPFEPVKINSTESFATSDNLHHHVCGVHHCSYQSVLSIQKHPALQQLGVVVRRCRHHFTCKHTIQRKTFQTIVEPITNKLCKHDARCTSIRSALGSSMVPAFVGIPAGQNRSVKSYHNKSALADTTKKCRT